MNELIMRRHSYCWNMLAAVALAWFYLWSGADQLLSAAGTTAVPEEAQKAFDKKQYEQVLEQLGKLVQEQGAAPDVRRLKIPPFSTLVTPRRHLASTTSWNSRSSKTMCLSFERWRWGSSSSW